MRKGDYMMGQSKVKILNTIDGIPVGSMGFIIELDGNIYKIYIPNYDTYLFLYSTDFERIVK